MEPEAQYSLTRPWPGLLALSHGRGFVPVVILFLSGFAYYLLGLVGLHFSHELQGFSAVWIPSGAAFFMVLLGGYRWAVAPLIGMSLVATHLQLPLAMGAGATLGATPLAFGATVASLMTSSTGCLCLPHGGAVQP